MGRHIPGERGKMTQGSDVKVRTLSRKFCTYFVNILVPILLFKPTPTKTFLLPWFFFTFLHPSVHLTKNTNRKNTEHRLRA